jgi:hypothetical protein
MAKKYNAGEVVLRFSDDGSVKILNKNVKEAGKSQASFAKNVNESDRRLKSLSQQTSNSTKGFSKQAQTISGGLVPVYATLAAQVFAVSAAFRFLADSFDTRNMIEGQKNFGMVTGTAYQHITANVQKASKSMLNFKDAAQAVAIGTAAGLTASQMERLGAAASNVSLALGRDVTDSFNRLVRGATKAEPELLDELGIVLRLDPALKAYAIELNKTKENLNQFEKSQAIVNEVLDQAERKFGQIEKYMDPNTLVLQQFGKEFDDLMNKFKIGLANFLTPAVAFLKENIAALVGVLVMAFLPVLKSILPAFDQMAEKAQQATIAASESVRVAQENVYGIQGGKKAEKFFANEAKTNRDQAGAGIKGMFESKKLKSPSMMHNQMNRQMIESTRRRLRTEGDLRKYFSKKERAELKNHLTQMEVALNQSEMKKRAMHTQTANHFKVLQAQTVLVYRKAQQKMVAITRMGAKAMNTAMKAAGYLGIALLLFDLGKSVVNFFTKGSQATQDAKKNAEDYTESLKALNAELGRMGGLRRSGALSQKEMVEQMGNAFGSADLSSKLQTLQGIQASGVLSKEEKDKAKAQFLESAKALENLSGPRKELTALIDAVQKGEDISTAAEGFKVLENNIRNVGTASKLQVEKIKTLNQAISSTVGGIAQLRGQKMAEAYAELLSSRGIGAEAGVSAEMQRNIGAIDPDALRAEAEGDFKLSGFAKRVMAGAQLGDDGFMGKHGKKRFEAAQEEIKAMKAAGQAAYDQGQKDKTRLTEEAAAFEAYTQKIKKEETEVQRIMDEGIAIDKEKLQTKLDLANIGFGFGEQQQLQRNALKNDKAITAEKEAQLALDGAKLNQRLLERDLTRDENGVLQETEEQFKIRQKAAEEAVNTAQKNLDIATQTKVNTQDEVEYLDSKVQFEFELLRLKNKQLEVQNRMAARTRSTEFDTSLFGFARARQERSDRIANMRDDKLMSTQLQTQLEGQLAKRQGPEFEKERLNLIKQINTEKQKQLDLDAKIAAEADKEYYATVNRLKAENELTAMKVFTLNPADQMYDKLRIELYGKGVELTKAQQVELRKLAAETTVLNQLNTEMQGLQDQMSSGFTQMFENFVSGTMSAKEAFKQFAADTLMYIAKMYARMAAFALLTSMGVPMPTMPGMGTGARAGGVMSSPGYRSYASGGVASGPDSGYLATLHGTEAVVPLGNDRSIPVELKGGAGSSVIVNITMAGGQSQTTTQGGGDGAGMEQLGRIIGGLVQKELADQQRPGGLLSPYNTNI